jgi:hypothetical protein
MSPSSARPSFFIGWDVGGWNCDRNSSSRDAIVILNEAKDIVGTPWRGNLRECIASSKTTQDWLKALFEKCEAQYPETRPSITMAIDAPLGFSDEFVNLITRKGFVEPDPNSGRNRYLFRYTERHLYESGRRPLSAVKDMIGSQSTKGMHVLAKFASQPAGCGVWTDGDAFRAIETYPAACCDTRRVSEFLSGCASLGDDKDDARICAVVAYLFATERDILEQPPADVPLGEGWIWLPRTEA